MSLEEETHKAEQRSYVADSGFDLDNDQDGDESIPR